MPSPRWYRSYGSRKRRGGTDESTEVDTLHRGPDLDRDALQAAADRLVGSGRHPRGVDHHLRTPQADPWNASRTDGRRCRTAGGAVLRVALAAPRHRELADPEHV